MIVSAPSPDRNAGIDSRSVALEPAARDIVYLQRHLHRR